MVKETKTKDSDVASFLTRTGFIFEMRIVELLKKKGYEPKVNYYFLDLDEEKKREIDIVATKEINKIVVHLIIECKQSLNDDWVFICSDDRPTRYCYTVKHIPRIYDLIKSNVFDHFHIYDENIPLAQNYLVFQKNKGKQAPNLQISECLHKLPKALIDIADNINEKTKSIFLPIGLFSRQIFTASYSKKLVVKEREIVQYLTKFESDAYKIRKEEMSFNPNILSSMSVSDSNKSLREIASKLGVSFQIDFVTEKGFKDYLKMIENEIKKVSTRKWTLNTLTSIRKRR